MWTDGRHSWLPCFVVVVSRIVLHGLGVKKLGRDLGFRGLGFRGFANEIPDPHLAASLSQVIFRG